jgi:hypothetical protein
MSSDPQEPGTDGDRQPLEPKPTEESPLIGLFRVLKRFLVPFVFSWALAYVGSAREIEWLYYAGLGGVTLSLVVLMIWLIS